MTWIIQFDKKASKELEKLDKPTQVRIAQELIEIKQLDNPREYGKPLSGRFVGLWRYRVGSYRIICRIVDNLIIITVVRIAHRKSVYD